MSLFDYLNSDSFGSSAPSTSANAQMTQIVQQAIATQGGTTTTSGGLTANQSSVLITLEAQRAHASATDSLKDAIDIAGELRAAMDLLYVEQGTRTPEVSAFSPRALSIIALNEDGSFSKTEVAAAKADLRARDRASAMAFLNSGELTASALKQYSQRLLAARDGMSAEERMLRDSDPDLR